MNNEKIPFRGGSKINRGVSISNMEKKPESVVYAG